MKNRIGKSLVADKEDRRLRANRLRRLHLESLEGRRLLSADTSVMSNTLIREDVNADFRVSALDALLVINQLNVRARGGEGEFSASNSSKPLFLDVNGDSRISALDALQIINRLNGEGEDTTLMRFTYSITNVMDPNNPSMETTLTQVAVGQQFQVNVFVADAREEDPAGVFSAAMDMGMSSLDLATFQFNQNFFDGILLSNKFDRTSFDTNPGLSQGSDFEEEYFNELYAVNAAPLSLPADPTAPLPFYSLRFTAATPGTLTFNPNGPDLIDSENNLFFSQISIPNSNIDFGSSFSITIITDPNIPVANPDTLVTRRGVSRTITNAELLANDTGVSLPLTVTGIQTVGSTQGTLVGNVYTPPAGFVGEDTLAYTIIDTEGRTASGTITINVLPPVDAVNDSFTIQVDSTNNTLDVRSNDTPTGLTITQVSTPNQGGTAAIAQSGTVIRYTPAPGFRGTETFTYTVRDNGGDGVVDTATVTITVVDRFPAAGSFTVSVNEFTQDNPIDVLANVQPNTGTQPVLIGLGSQPANGVATIDDNGTPADATDDFVRYTPNPGFVGVDSFTYVANDTKVPQEPNSTGTVTINVLEVNFPPIIVNDTVNTLEKQGATIPIATLLSNDQAFLPGQTLSLTSVRALSTEGGSVSISGNNVIYTPSPNYFFGQFLFEYTATDDYVRPLSAVGTVTVNVSPVNDPPVIPNNIEFRGFKNFPLVIPVASVLQNVQPGPPNESGQTLSIVSVGANATNNGTNVGTVVLNATAGTITFTPNQDYTGPANFSITVRDSGGTANGGVDTAQGQVRVNVEEFQPSAIGGKAWIDENRNGTMDGHERFLGGLEVTLTGTSLGQPIAPQTMVTLADGSYEFLDLGPGSYQISFQAPAFMLPSSSFGTSHDVQIAEPGGLNVTQNYAVIGFTSQYAQWMSQLVSNYYYTDPSMAYRGALFALGSDNSLLWGMKLDGYSSAVFTEAVFNGDRLLLTVVDANHTVRTAELNRGQYAFVRDAAGNALVRVLGSMSDFEWAQVDRNAPAYQAAMYLHSVDEVFEQRDW